MSRGTQVLRRVIVAVEEFQHLHRFFVRLRRIDRRAMHEVEVLVGEAGVSAHALDGREALVPHEFQKALALAALFGGRGGPGDRRVADRMNEPAELRNHIARVGRAALGDHFEARHIGQRVSAAPLPASRARMPCITFEIIRGAEEIAAHEIKSVARFGSFGRRPPAWRTPHSVCAKRASLGLALFFALGQQELNDRLGGNSAF